MLSGNKKKKSILIGHPYWGRGGAEIAAMWMLQALVEEYRITIVTRGGWNLEDLNKAAGTNIPLGVIRIASPPLSEMTFGGAFGLAHYYRYCRKIAKEYDLCITASRVIDWGLPSVHFLSDVVWNQELQRRFDSAEHRARRGGVRNFYWALADQVAGKSKRPPREHDLFICNSKWTANISQPFCSRSIKVVCPAVPGAFVNTRPWNERENAFVCLGRVSAEKKLEKVVAILEEVRRNGICVKLHLVGLFENNGYADKILKLCDERNDWITVHGQLYGSQKEELLTRCRYGISGCDREAFGIATAEMIRAGIIPFVPHGGAQKELVGYDMSLCYGSIPDAVQKITSIAESTDSQLFLKEKIRRIGSCFTPDRFCSEIKSLIRDFINENSTPN